MRTTVLIIATLFLAITLKGNAQNQPWFNSELT
jgi:hypothetical protein